MQIKWLYNYYTLFCIHVCIVLLAFTSFFRHPNISTLSDHGGDETKNYFTLNSYVKEPIGEDGILKYNHLSYPFGDYVYYTDNTPLFSVPFRWYCHHISDISNKAIPIFNLFIILNIILSGLLVFSILKYLLADNKIAFIMAIILPWTNVQVLRIMHGHFNLSLSSLFLLGIYLLILWHKNKDAKGKLITIGFAMFLLSMVSFFIHGYYIAILTTFIAAMLFTYGIWNFKQRIGKISIATVIIYPAITLVSALLIVSQTDKYLPLRKDIANGYDWMDQKALFTSLFSNYYFQHLYVPICNLKNPAAVEQAGYMGNVSLFAVLIIGIIAFLKKGFRSEIRAIQIDFFKDSLRASIFIGSLVMLFISFGEHYYTGNRIDNNGMEIFNILNPYYLIHKFTNRVEQFRCLGRFLWPFYFGFNIWVLYTIVVLYKRSEKNIRLFIILAMLFVGGFETVDFAQEIHRRVRISHNYFNTTTLDSLTLINARQFYLSPIILLGLKTIIILLTIKNNGATILLSCHHTLACL